MADIAQEMRYKIDVKNGLVKQPMSGVLMRGDNNANRIIVELVDGDKTVSLDGVTVTGKFFRGGDGINIPLDGAASGNEASVLLDEHCYAVDGYFEASVKLTTGGATRTILTITGHVESDGEGGILDIENVIPSVADIVAQYQRMQEVTAQTEAATKTANDAAANANTETGKANAAANNANNQAEAAKSAAAAANAAAKNWGNSTAANSEKLGGKAPEYYIQPRNLLDNSDFRNPVMQAGFNGLHGSEKYVIDRWLHMYQLGSAEKVSDGIALTGAEFYMSQKIGEDVSGKTLTFAVCLADGSIVRGAANVSELSETVLFARYEELYLMLVNGYFSIRNASESTYTIRWAVLYEGSYTADTLPPYVPKGYAAELAECLRYYADAGRFYSKAYDKYTLYNASIQAPLPMRKKPSVILRSPSTNADNAIYQSGVGDITDFAVTADSNRGAYIGSPNGGFVEGNEYTWYAFCCADL